MYGSPGLAVLAAVPMVGGVEGALKQADLGLRVRHPVRRDQRLEDLAHLRRLPWRVEPRETCTHATPGRHDRQERRRARLAGVVEAARDLDRVGVDAAAVGPARERQHDRAVAGRVVIPIGVVIAHAEPTVLRLGRVGAVAGRSGGLPAIAAIVPGRRFRLDPSRYRSTTRRRGRCRRDRRRRDALFPDRDAGVPLPPAPPELAAADASEPPVTSALPAVPTVKPARAATAVRPCRARPDEPKRPVPTPGACARSTLRSLLRSPLGLSPCDLSACRSRSGALAIGSARRSAVELGPVAVGSVYLRSVDLGNVGRFRGAMAARVGALGLHRASPRRAPAGQRSRGRLGRIGRRRRPADAGAPPRGRDPAHARRTHGTLARARRTLALRSGPSRARRRHPGRLPALLRAVGRCHCQVRRRWTIQALPRSLDPPRTRPCARGGHHICRRGSLDPTRHRAVCHAASPAGRAAAERPETADRRRRHTVNNACTSRPASRLRPFRNPSSNNTQSPATIPPACSTSPSVASAVPPVASTSSTTSTRCPATNASVWTSRVACAVFQRVRRRDGGPGQLARLAYGDHADARRVRDSGRDHEAARLDAGDDVEGERTVGVPIGRHDAVDQLTERRHRRRTADSGP